jgi:hypothetical protein
LGFESERKLNRNALGCPLKVTPDLANLVLDVGLLGVKFVIDLLKGGLVERAVRVVNESRDVAILPRHQGAS